MGMLTSLFERRGALITGDSLQNPSGYLLSMFGTQSVTGMRVTPETSLEATPIYAAVKLLAETVAQLPFLMYRRGPNDSREKDIGHPLFAILRDQPNPWQTAFEFWEMMMGFLLTRGNAYAGIVSTAGKPVEQLVPLHPARTRVYRKDGINWYQYQPWSGPSIVLRQDEVMHLKDLTLDGIVGVSRIYLGRESVGLALAAEQFGSRMFSNGATPSGVVEHPSQLSDVAYSRLKEEVDAKWSGLHNAHRAIILEEGMKWAQISTDPDKAQLLETRKFTVTDAARLYRIPPHMIGDLERSTHSNIEQQSIEFVVYSVVPWLVRIEQAVRRDLFTQADRKTHTAEFEVAGLLRGDQPSRYTAYNLGRNMGALSVNDILRKEGMNLIGPEGDVRLMPINYQNLEKALDLEDSTEPPPDPNQPNPDAPIGTNALPGPAETRSVVSRRKLRKAYRGLFQDAAGRMVRRETKAIREAVDKMLVQRSKEKRGLPEFLSWMESFYKEHQKQVAQALGPVMMSYGHAVHSEARLELGVDDDPSGDPDDGLEPPDDLTPELQRFVTDYAERMASRQVASSIAQIRTVIQGLQDGDDPAAAIGKRLDAWSATRAAKVADWETVSAEGAVARFCYDGEGRGALWHSERECCSLCTSMHGQSAARGQPFIAKGQQIQGDDDQVPLTAKRDIHHGPLHSGCVCSIKVK